MLFYERMDDLAASIHKAVNYMETFPRNQDLGPCNCKTTIKCHGARSRKHERPPASSYVEEATRRGGVVVNGRFLNEAPSECGSRVRESVPCIRVHGG